jgi:hypothetical protein
MKRFTMHVLRARDSCTSYATENTDYLTVTIARIEIIKISIIFLHRYTAHRTTPLTKIHFAKVRGPAKSPPTVHSNCSEAVYLAARTCGQRPAFLRSVVIFVNMVRFPPVRYCQIPSTFLRRQRYSRFGGHNERGS